ncbi:hypothetical protein E2C01_031181 [Portunus trituberculatus]|uniref:Uncharacterized protein n=1 Tax=Portunus trituberculatus TaxID=210409 RepID=A0A5B7EST5_PORTR|nr:hypothetical protein [Portunus trituberculatus]
MWGTPEGVGSYSSSSSSGSGCGNSRTQSRGHRRTVVGGVTPSWGCLALIGFLQQQRVVSVGLERVGSCRTVLMVRLPLLCVKRVVLRGLEGVSTRHCITHVGKD